MFLENEYARPLFDTVNGGPPRAYQCKQCDRVVRTERGIIMYLKSKHDWEEQQCLYSTGPQNDQKNGAPRKLRAGPPIFQNDLEKPAEKILPNQKPAEMNEGELLKLMKEGN